jgi:hypothetical protein
MRNGRTVERVMDVSSTRNQVMAGRLNSLCFGSTTTTTTSITTTTITITIIIIIIIIIKLLFLVTIAYGIY